MNDYQWDQMLEYSFLNVWSELSAHLPNILAAIVILFIGYMVASTLKGVIVRLASHLQVDSAIQATGANAVIERTGYKLNTGRFLGTLVKWFVLIVFFIFALDVLNLTEATTFLTGAILSYLPRVFVATIILFGATIVASFVQNLVVAAATAANSRSAQLLGRFAKTAVIVFAVLAALNELQIADELVQMLFAGLVFALSLALGLSFGLGGKDAASRYIEKATRSAQNTRQ